MTLAKGLGSGCRSGPAWRAGGREAVQAGQPRLHVRRQPARLRGRARDARHHRGRRALANAVAHRASFIREGFRRDFRRRRREGNARLGLMIGVELGRALRRAGQAGARRRPAHQRHRGHVVRLLPPLVYTREDATTAMDRLAPLITEFLGKHASAAAQPALQSA